ncbi:MULTISPECIES: sensor histidine kinase [unclassified Micromonospora]|uniref:sensor histidine kinase n=1 Tax=unclassified Micromonospora TaxID=2617518 RepID=UPI001C5FC57C|nr:histidine kinase [Micromonospora sp. RL09-050-HVF-A]MBW4701988.1 two-component sensor histidine kinase [Micromonospora sp. RL09-050-HVF-A]
MVDLRTLADRWRRWPVTVRDLPLALLIALACAPLPVLQDRSTQLGDLPGRPFDALAVVAIALECLPLAVRRRWPGICLALVSVGFAIDQVRAYHSVAGTALAVALLSAGVHLQRRRRTTLVVGSAAYVALAVALHRQGSTEGVGGFLTFYLASTLAWGVGAWLRQSRAAEAERRRVAAVAARATERARIAGELHDIVTHHVTAMVVQAEAARYLTAAPDRLDTTLTAISDTGRRAITDLRILLDLLNPDHHGDPRVPSVGALHALVEQTRQAGQPVEFTQEGSPAGTVGGAEAAAYRVVQEALTNALKYAHGSRTAVHVRHGKREITVEIDTDGPGTHPAGPGGSGRGLTGLRERVTVLGGEFSAQRRDDDGFVVRARIPTGDAS